jgi:hypothetical protein
MKASGFIAKCTSQQIPTGIVAFPVAYVMLVAKEFLLLRHRYRKECSRVKGEVAGTDDKNRRTADEGLRGRDLEEL